MLPALPLAVAVSVNANGTAAKLRRYQKKIDGYLGLGIKIPIPGEQPQELQLDCASEA